MGRLDVQTESCMTTPHALQQQLWRVAGAKLEFERASDTLIRELQKLERMIEGSIDRQAFKAKYGKAKRRRA